MNTLKSLEKIKNMKPSKEFEAKTLAIKRESTTINLLKECNDKLSLKSIPEIEEDGKKIQFIPKDIIQQIFQLQETLLRIGIYLTIDWNTNSYKALDLTLGKEYTSHEETNS